MYYVAGGFYEAGLGKMPKFALVHPTGGLPYVWAFPLPYRTHTEHHASIYSVGEDDKTLTIVRRGECRDCDPVSVEMGYSLAQDVRAAIMRLENEIACKE